MPCGGGGIGGGGALIMSTSMAATEPNRVGDESLLRPLLRTVPAAGEREVVEQAEEKKEGRPASRPTSAHDVCRSGFVGWGGPGFGCPAGNFSKQKVCVWGKALVVRDRGRRVGGEQGARFAGRRRAAAGGGGRLLAFAGGSLLLGRAKLKIDFKRSGQEGKKKKDGDPLQPSLSHPLVLKVDRQPANEEGEDDGMPNPTR